MRFLLLLTPLCLVSCDSPLSLCTDQVAAFQAAHDRCETGVSYTLTRTDGTPTTCEQVTEVVDGDGVICDCIPWAQSVECADLVREPGVVPQGCETEALYRLE